MRIISGSAKGMRLDSLEGNDTRPTLDRVKEALFNIIQTNIKQASVLDLFSGSGALGIEALSRGAKKVVFCDNSYSATEIINKNLTKTKLIENSIIIKKDYIKALEDFYKKEKFDIIFVDPPYAKNIAIKAVEKIINLDLLEKKGIIIIETDDEKRELES